MNTAICSLLKRVFLPLAIMVVLAAGTFARAEAYYSMRQKAVVDTVGNADFTITLVLPAPSANRPAPAAEDIAAYLDLRNLGFEAEGLRCERKDNRTIEIHFRVAGWAMNKGKGRWQATVLESARMLFPNPTLGSASLSSVPYWPSIKGNVIQLRARPTIKYKVKQGQGFQYKYLAACDASIEIVLPVGSTGKFDAARSSITYQTGTPRFTLQARPAIRPALQKLLGDPRYPGQWLARFRFDNASPEKLHNFRIHYQVEFPGGRVDWDQRFATVQPGQTLQQPYYPLLPAAICKITAKTKGAVTASYEYERPDGQKVQGKRSASFDILGLNEGIPGLETGSYAGGEDIPALVASYVMGKDPVILCLKGQLCHAIDGTHFREDDTQALKYLQVLYRFLADNYTCTAPTRDGELLFGRDLLTRDSGSPLNLAILYASVLEAGGFDAHVFIHNGRAYAGVALPSGKVMAIDLSGCRGGSWWINAPSFAEASRMSGAFDRAVKAGDSLLDGKTFLDIDIAELREQGLSNPELPPAAFHPAGKVFRPLDPTCLGLTVRRLPDIVRDGKQGALLLVQVEINSAWNKWIAIVARKGDNSPFTSGTHSIFPNRGRYHAVVLVFIAHAEIREHPEFQVTVEYAGKPISTVVRGTIPQPSWWQADPYHFVP